MMDFDETRRDGSVKVAASTFRLKQIDSSSVLSWINPWERKQLSVIEWGGGNLGWKFTIIKLLCFWKFSSFSDMILLTLTDIVGEIFSITPLLLEKFGREVYQQMPKNGTML